MIQLKKVDIIMLIKPIANMDMVNIIVIVDVQNAIG